jgi:hypothetical protein
MPEDLVPPSHDSRTEVAGPGVPPAASQSAVERVAERAREFSLRGFKQFFYLTNRAEGVNLTLSRHAARGIKAAIDEIKADKPEKQTIWEWHRESAKTTVATTFAAWLLGHRPDGTVLVFHANDTAAQALANTIAERVDSPLYRVVFPHIEPDIPRGWGNNGYELKRTDVPYTEWMQEASNRITPNILGLGLYSAAIRSKRATLLLLADDVISDDVAVSEKELREAGRRFDDAIRPLATASALVMVSGTPQATGDILDVQKKRGVGTLVRVPIYDENGNPNWPEIWPKNRCLARENSVGALSWAKNYLLDLKKASEIPLRYFTFPADQIDTKWVAAAGVDYASQMAATSARPGRSHYACAYGLIRPVGGVVVYDGVLGQFSQEDCEFYTAQAQNLFENFRGTVVEAIGKGEEHFNTLMRRPGLKLVPHKSHRKSKPDRLVMDLGPHLQRGSLLLSNADTPFLATARRFAEQYPAVSNDDPGWDVWDSIYLMSTILIQGLIAGTKSDFDPSFRQRPESPWGKLAHSKL